MFHMEQNLMDKYFETLDMAAFRMHAPNGFAQGYAPFQACARYVEHEAGPEADYIIRTWKKERGVNKND